MASQSIGDRFVSAQQTVAGSVVSKSVYKSTTSQTIGPKKKHLDFLCELTNKPHIDIPHLVDLLLERSKQLKWVTVFKSLITSHHLMCYGHEKFTQNLASRNSVFNLSTFLDRNGAQSYDMSNYIRRYAAYLNEKAISYRTTGYDFARIQRGKGGLLRSLDNDKLLKTLHDLQQLLDALLEFGANQHELTNGVVVSAFLLLFKDLMRLFACYNDGVINLLEKYFHMKKAQCREALQFYKKFLTTMSKISDLFEVAVQVGINKGDIPNLNDAPASLLEALQNHLDALEGKKVNKKPDNEKFNFPKVNGSQQKIGLSEQDFKLKSQNDRALHTNNDVTSAVNEMAEMFDIFNSSVNNSSADAIDTDFSFFPQPHKSQEQLFEPELLQPTKLDGGEFDSLQQSNMNQTLGSKDYESSLANVMANLTTGGQKANQQFEPKPVKKLTGGSNFASMVAPTPLTLQTSPMHNMMVPVPQQPLYQFQAAPMMTIRPQYVQQPTHVMPINYGQPYAANMPVNFQQTPINNVSYSPAMLGNMSMMGYQQTQPRALNPNNPFGSM